MGANDKYAATFHGGDTMKRITADGGPISGNQYDVPDDTTRLDLPVEGGHYTVGPKRANWKPDEPPRRRSPQLKDTTTPPAPNADTPE